MTGVDDPVVADRCRGAGARTWYFPDGDLPWPDRMGPFRGHESLLVFNVSAEPAELRLDLYFTDADPVLDIAAECAPERVVVLHPPYGRLADGTEVRLEVRRQYALRVRSSVPEICQFGRVECRPAFAVYTTMGWGGRDAG